MTTNDIIVLFDEASFQNEPYTQKSLYKRGTKHTQTVNPYKFKINATGSLTINGNSAITITNSSTAPEIAIAFLELRVANTNNKNTVKILNKIISDVNLTDEDIDKLLIENNENNEVFAAKILKTLEKYKDDTTSTIARIIGKHCNRESLNNVKKRREIRRKIILNPLQKEDITSKYNINIAFIQIYLEMIQDLFEPNNQVKIREDPDKGVFLENCLWIKIKNPEEFEQVFKKGEKII